MAQNKYSNQEIEDSIKSILWKHGESAAVNNVVGGASGKSRNSNYKKSPRDRTNGGESGKGASSSDWRRNQTSNGTTDAEAKKKKPKKKKPKKKKEIEADENTNQNNPGRKRSRSRDRQRVRNAKPNAEEQREAEDVLVVQQMAGKFCLDGPLFVVSHWVTLV